MSTALLPFVELSNDFILLHTASYNHNSISPYHITVMGAISTVTNIDATTTDLEIPHRITRAIDVLSTQPPPPDQNTSLTFQYSHPQHPHQLYVNCKSTGEIKIYKEQ